MPRKARPHLAVIENLADIPSFDTEEEEATYWDTHQLSPALLATMRTPTEEEAPRPRHTRSISLRMDEGVLERLQILADKAQCPYQTLLKEFVRERIEQVEQGTLYTEAAGSRPVAGEPLPRRTAAWAATHAHLPNTAVDLIVIGKSDRLSSVLIEGFSAKADTRYLTLNDRLTMDQAIDFLVKLRDQQ